MDQSMELIPGEAVDLDDDLKLTQLVDLVRSLTELPVYVSLLTIEQWHGVLEQLPKNKLGMSLHLHVLPDSRQPHHLFVSPMAVRGINAGEGPIILETVTWLLALAGTTAPAIIRNGIHDLLLSVVRRRSNLEFPTGHHPSERLFAHRLLEVLAMETGFSKMEWLCEIKRDPEALFKALRRTSFAGYWVKQVKKEEPSLAYIFESHKHNKTAFAEALQAARPNDDVARVTDKLVQSWLRNKRQEQSENSNAS